MAPLATQNSAFGDPAAFVKKLSDRHPCNPFCNALQHKLKSNNQTIFSLFCSASKSSLTLYSVLPSLSLVIIFFICTWFSSVDRRLQKDDKIAKLKNSLTCLKPDIEYNLLLSTCFILKLLALRWIFPDLYRIIPSPRRKSGRRGKRPRCIASS